MKEYNFSFGDIILHKENLAEIISKKGVIMDEEAIEECRNFLSQHLHYSYSLLVNKKYQHSYTPEAQRMMSNIKGVKVLGVVIGADRSIIPSNILFKINQHNPSNVKLFNKRSQAIAWLEKSA